MFRYRLGLVRQRYAFDRCAVLFTFPSRNRLMRREAFSAPLLRSAVAEDHLQLTPIDSLLGSSGVRNVLGMLAQLEDGKWFLEDEKGSIPVDLSNATITAGLFTEGVIVIARGTQALRPFISCSFAESSLRRKTRRRTLCGRSARPPSS